MPLPFRPTWLRLNEAVAELVEQGFTEDEARAELTRALQSGRMPPYDYNGHPSFKLAGNLLLDNSQGLKWKASPVIDFANSTLVVPLDPFFYKLPDANQPVVVEIRTVDFEQLWPRDEQPDAMPEPSSAELPTRGDRLWPDPHHTQQTAKAGTDPEQRIGKTSPLRERAVRALAQTFPEGIPDQISLSNGELLERMKGVPELKEVSNDTILRAAGRRK